MSAPLKRSSCKLQDLWVQPGSRFGSRAFSSRIMPFLPFVITHHSEGLVSFFKSEENFPFLSLPPCLIGQNYASRPWLAKSITQLGPINIHAWEWE